MQGVYERFIAAINSGAVPLQSDIEQLSDGIVWMQSCLITSDYQELVALLNDYA